MSKLDFISKANPDKRWLEGLYEAFCEIDRRIRKDEKGGGEERWLDLQEQLSMMYI